MPKNIHPNLPWYLNHTLPEHERQQVESAVAQQDALLHDELAAWKQVQAALKAQPAQTASPNVRRLLMQRVQNEPQAAPSQGRWVWHSVSYAALVASIFMLLWLVVQPGIVLEWVNESAEISAFRVYRTAANHATYELLAEIPAHSEMAAYNFVDAWFLPGQQATYVVEGITASGQAAFSQAVSDDGLAALPGQLALLVSSSILAGLLFTMMKSTPKIYWRQRLAL